jgi:hypothetical protein
VSASTVYTYIADQDLPGIGLDWRDRDNALIDFSTGWTFTVKLIDESGNVDLTKTVSITGAATSPNVQIAWAAGELAALTTGRYRMLVYARDTLSRDRVFRPASPPIVQIIGS